MAEFRNPLKPPYQAKSDELVVSLEHVELVRSTLADAIGGSNIPATRSPQLGLALLRIPNAGRVAQGLVEQLAADEIPDDPRYPDPGGAVPIDRVLWALRRRFRYSYARWSPLLGKNRLVGRLHGVNGIVIHTGEHSPTPLPNGSKPPSPRGTGPGHGVRVGLLDTGLYPNPWLAGGWAARYSDMLNPNGSTDDVEGHATFVAGLILSQAPGATVEVRRVLNSQGEADSWSVAEKLVGFGTQGLDVVNLSFACYTEDGEAPLVLATAIDRLDPATVVVAAAGNHGDVMQESEDGLSPLSPAWPAALDDVIAVGAVRPDGRRASFSPDAPWIDVHARGVEVRSTFLPAAFDGSTGGAHTFDGWAEWTGTSFAAGLVSGAIAGTTQPGRVTSAEAVHDMLRALSSDKNLPLVGQTSAKFLNLPAPGDIA